MQWYPAISCFTRSVHRVLHTKKKPLHVRHEGPEFPEHPSPLTDGFLTLPSLWADNPSAYSSSHPHGTSSPAPGSSLSLSHVFLLLSFGSLKVYGSIILRLCPSWLPLDRLPEWPRSRPWPNAQMGPEHQPLMKIKKLSRE